MRIPKAILAALLVVGLVSAGETEHVVIVVMDGVRHTETFGDPTHENIPNIRALAENGTRYKWVVNRNDHTVTRPGHATLLTGAYQPGYENYPVGIHPDNATIFERYRKSTGAPVESCQMILHHQKIIEPDAYSCDPAYGSEYGANVTGLTTDYRNLTDNRTAKLHWPILASQNATITMVNFGYTDCRAHAGDWQGYIRAIRNTDRLVGKLWRKLQANPEYANHTTMIMTNDHGRTADDWCDHRSGDASCRRIMLVVIGPDTPAGQVITTGVDMTQIASAAMELLGIDPGPGMSQPFPGVTAGK